jgi:hypothetical protein
VYSGLASIRLERSFDARWCCCLSTNIDRWIAQMPRAEIEAEIARLKSRLATLEHFLALTPPAVPPGEVRRGRAAVVPRLDNAIVEIVNEDAARDWSISEITKALSERGIGERDEKAVAATLSRLVRAGRLVRPGRGVYRSLHIQAGD